MDAFNPTLAWPAPPVDWPGLGSEVHVWAFALDLPPPALAPYAASLCSEERARAARFHFEVHRGRYIAGRGRLRGLLGRYLGVAPETIALGYNPRGKPALAGSQAACGLQFNLAHTGGLGLLAVTQGAALGVDVEEIRVLAEVDALVERFFSARENALFCRLRPEDKPTAFFNLWTRKEAWLKATGEGIGELLNRVEVTFLPDEPARLLHLPPGWAGAGEWQLSAFCPAQGYAAALACAGSGRPLRCWRWPETAQSAA